MTVAILMPMAEQRGGGELMLSQLLKHGQRPNLRWIVIFFEDGPLVSEFEALGIETQIVETGRLRHLRRFVKSVSMIASIAKGENADLILSWSTKPHLYGGLAALWAGTDSAWFQLGSPEGRHLSAIDRIATALPAKGIFTLSRAGSKAQEALWPHRPTHLVYPSVDIQHFDPSLMPAPSNVRDQLGLPTDVPLIGMVGRLQHWKGMHVLIDAMPHVLHAYSKAHCVIVGGHHDLEPDYPPALQDQVSSLGIQDRVTFAGFQRNVPEWMQAMDVVVHASDHEPFGIVIIEAMALAKPVVAGDAGGPREIITDGVNGLLAPFGDHRALARQILKYLNEPEFARDVGRAARRRALDFTPEQYAERFIDNLHRLMGTKDKAPESQAIPL